jgi:hypothetical protein
VSDTCLDQCITPTRVLLFNLIMSIFQITISVVVSLSVTSPVSVSAYVFHSPLLTSKLTHLLPHKLYSYFFFPRYILWTPSPIQILSRTNSSTTQQSPSFTTSASKSGFQWQHLSGITFTMIFICSFIWIHFPQFPIMNKMRLHIQLHSMMD